MTTHMPFPQQALLPHQPQGAPRTRHPTGTTTAAASRHPQAQRAPGRMQLMNMAGVVQAPKRATLAPAAATPADRLDAMSGEDRRGSRPTDTRSEEIGRPVWAASHSATGARVPAPVGNGKVCMVWQTASMTAAGCSHSTRKQAPSRTCKRVANEEHHAAATGLQWVGLLASAMQSDKAIQQCRSSRARRPCCRLGTPLHTWASA